MSKRTATAKRKRSVATKRKAKPAAKRKPRLAVLDLVGVCYAASTDRPLVLAAIRKQLDGESLTDREARAVVRWQKATDAATRAAHYKAIPSTTWRKMADRQARTIIDQAHRYGLPIDGATIDLAAVVYSLHRFLSVNAARLAGRANGISAGEDSGEGDLAIGEASPMLEKWRAEKWRAALFDNEERERNLISRAEIDNHLGALASMLRGGAERLERHYGPDARQILDDVLDEFTRHVETWVAS